MALRRRGVCGRGRVPQVVILILSCADRLLRFVAALITLQLLSGHSNFVTRQRGPLKCGCYPWSTPQLTHTAAAAAAAERRQQRRQLLVLISCNIFMYVPKEIRSRVATRVRTLLHCGLSHVLNWSTASSMYLLHFLDEVHREREKCRFAGSDAATRVGRAQTMSQSMRRRLIDLFGRESRHYLRCETAIALCGRRSYDFPAWPWPWPMHRVPDPGNSNSTTSTTTTSGSLIGFEMEKLDQVALDGRQKCSAKSTRKTLRRPHNRLGTSCTRCLPACHMQMLPRQQ